MITRSTHLVQFISLVFSYEVSILPEAYKHAVVGDTDGYYTLFPVYPSDFCVAAIAENVV
jgi:hypothetical protein